MGVFIGVYVTNVQWQTWYSGTPQLGQSLQAILICVRRKCPEPPWEGLPRSWEIKKISKTVGSIWNWHKSQFCHNNPYKESHVAPPTSTGNLIRLLLGRMRPVSESYRNVAQQIVYHYAPTGSKSSPQIERSIAQEIAYHTHKKRKSTICTYLL